MREIQIMKRLQSEEQHRTCTDDSGQESEISPSPLSETSVSTKPDTHQTEDTRVNKLTPSDPSPIQNHARFKSILERFRDDQESVLNSHKGRHICSQEIARNSGCKSISVKLTYSRLKSSR